MRYQTVCSGMSFLYCSLIHSCILGMDQYPPLSTSFARASNTELSHFGLPSLRPPLFEMSAEDPPSLYRCTQTVTLFSSTASWLQISKRFLPCSASMIAFILLLNASSRACRSFFRSPASVSCATTMSFAICKEHTTTKRYCGEVSWGWYHNLKT